MIIFYDNKTGTVIGTIEGFGHTEQQRGMLMTPGGMEPEQVGKLILERDADPEQLAMADELADGRNPLTIHAVRVKNGKLTRINES